MHLSADKLLPWVYPKVDCRLAFVDSGAPGRGCVYSFLDEQDGHHPQLRGHGGRHHVHRRPYHWLKQLHRHDHGGGAVRSTPIASSLTSVAAPTTLVVAPTTLATSTTTPTTRHPLLCYKGRQIDNTDLLGPSTKLFSLLALTTSRNNNRREERRYDNRDHRHDNKSKSSRARQFCRHRPDFHPKISTLLISYLFLA